jgi:hypothetical protein
LLDVLCCADEINRISNFTPSDEYRPAVHTAAKVALLS